MSYLTEKHTKNIICSKRLEKIDNNDIPFFHQYYLLFKYNYNLHQLKIFVKHYKLKLTGNKSQLVNRIYFFLYFSFFACKIQKILRGVIQRKYNLAHGPAFKNRSLCINKSDFLTVDNLEEIPLEQFFSYKDIDGFIYGFDIVSLYNLITKCNGILKNPYNRQCITNKTIMDLKTLLRLSKILNIPICTDIKETSDEVTQEKSLELRILSLFQEIDSLGNYSEASWFTSLNRMQLIKFLRELIDIWTFRAQLDSHVKLLICPPNGNPFTRNNPIVFLNNCNDIFEMQNYIIDILEKFVNTNASRDNRSLGAYYVLGALTLVNQNASIALPWLYQSFCYI
jgi:hypothetical protein